MAQILQIDLKIAEVYAPIILESIGYGERQINVWLPGSGKTTITNDIVENKKLVKNTLGKIADRVIFVPISCELASQFGLDEVFDEVLLNLKIINNNLTFPDKLIKISNWCQEKIVYEDKEIVLLINNIDDLELSELNKLLMAIFKIISVNKRRILSILNINRIDLLENNILSNPLLLTFANRVKYIPLLPKELLNCYVKEKADIYLKSISQTEMKRLINTYGGVLTLLKEAVKSYPNKNLIDIKTKSLFANINLNQLQKFNCQNLKVFENQSIFTNKNNICELKTKLKGKYRILFEYFEKHRKKIASKDEIADLLWSQDEDNFVSDWAINQVISRFRKKLFKFGVDPEKLETINGKGYLWN